MAQRSKTISRLANFPERLARMITDWAGSSPAFLTAVAVLVLGLMALVVAAWLWMRLGA